MTMSTATRIVFMVGPVWERLGRPEADADGEGHALQAGPSAGGADAVQAARECNSLETAHSARSIDPKVAPPGADAARSAPESDTAAALGFELDARR
jgi:hypothetical protein